MSSVTYPNFKFETLKKSSKSAARLGRLTTPHGAIETPNYIFCGTKAALRCMTAADAKRQGAQIILSNTYHLMIQPGADTIEKLGGLHKIMGWDGPMLTDSGGFQIFSMGHGTIADEIKGRRNDGRDKMLQKITEEGAVFKSYKDGKMLKLTPEDSMQIQRKLGADIIVQLDECTAFHVDKDYTAKSMRMSHRWGDRSLTEFNLTNDGKQAVYGIMQGGIYEDLRRESAEYTKDRDFFGTAIGGSLGGSRAQMVDVVGVCMKYAHPDRPVHLLGIGGVQDVFDNIKLGIDTFDCVSPTRIARHGWALVKGVPNERINLRNAKFKEDITPLAEDQDNPASQFSRGYLHHLLKAHEPLAAHIISQHNVATISRLMREIRGALAEDRLEELEREWIV